MNMQKHIDVSNMPGAAEPEGVALNEALQQVNASKKNYAS